MKPASFIKKGCETVQLQPGERSLLAYFNNYDDALEASQTLRRLGYDIVAVDPVNWYTERPGRSHPYSISAITGMWSDSHRYGYGPLLASDPIASGMAISAFPETYTHIVTVVTDEKQFNNAVESLRKHGANV